MRQSYLRPLNADRFEQRREQPPVGESDPQVLRTKPESAHDIHRKRDDLRVAERTRLADQITIELEVLSKPPPLLPLVAEELRDREPADGLLELAGLRGHHARQGRRHLRPERHLTIPFVDEVVQLTDDLVPALGRVELQRLQRRPVVLLEPVPGRYRTPGPEDVGAQGEISGVKVAKARQGLGFHGGNIRGHEA